MRNMYLKTPIFLGSRPDVIRGPCSVRIHQNVGDHLVRRECIGHVEPVKIDWAATYRQTLIMGLGPRRADPGHRTNPLGRVGWIDANVTGYPGMTPPSKTAK
jgi:hypothetical protein